MDNSTSSMELSQTSSTTINGNIENNNDAIPHIKNDQNEDQRYNVETNHHTNVILEQERFMPIANISRIMKRVLPERAKLSKEAKECIQECVTEFFLFITSEAAENCNHEKRKTITGDDLLNSMETLGFDTYVPVLKAFLKKFREATRSERGDSEDKDHEIQQITTINPHTQYQNAQIIHPRTQLYQQQRIPEAQTPQPSRPRSQQQDRPESSNITQLPPHFRQVTDIYIDTSTMQHYIYVENPDAGYIPIEIRATSTSGQVPRPLPAQYFHNNVDKH